MRLRKQERGAESARDAAHWRARAPVYPKFLMLNFVMNVD
jgi:hypothetical protein